MARTIEDIQAQMIETMSTTPLATKLTSTSTVAIWRLWIYIVAFAIWLHETIVERNAENSRPHNVNWYKQQALAYVDGLELVWQNGQFSYETENITDLQERKIISRVAVLESSDGELVIKVAKDNNGSLSALTIAELLRFKTYMNDIKDAGNRLRIISYPADVLRANLKIYVDPLIIDLETGEHLTQNGFFPIRNAIDSYLENLEFNGAFVKEYFRDALQKAEGVRLPLINSVESKYGLLPFAEVVEWKVPESGYFVLENAELTIQYLPYEI